MKQINLCGEWTLTDKNGKEYSATVPGCVHTDIVKENMFWRDNSKNCRWIEEEDWLYTRTFEVEQVENNAYLVFEGLDVYCDIFLNGEKVGSAENMFIPHKFCVDGYLRTGENTLSVQFYSPIERVRDMPARYAAFSNGRLNTRRMQCTYGWDWVDRFVTCGIFRRVYLLFDRAFAVDNVYVYTCAVDEYGALIKVAGEARNFSKGAMCRFCVLAPNGKCVYEKCEYINTQYFDENINIDSPELWYPAGYGEQPLYTLLIEYYGETFRQPFGIRTVRILEKKDMPGEPNYEKCAKIKKEASAVEYDKNEEFFGFILIVNGIKIMCKGFNYVPCEPFPSAETPEKITKLLELTKESGANMLRIWGGGLYETTHFFDECDRLGIMVIHDFLMACGNYPEDETWFLEALQKEARFAALHLRNHPCLMWWQGDNENAVKGSYELENYTGKRSAYCGILPVLRSLDYTRHLLPSSPYGGKFFASKTVGTTHNTQFLSYVFKYLERENTDDYKEIFANYTARFISEETALGAAEKTTLLRMMTEEDLYSADMEMWRYHTKSGDDPAYDIFDHLLWFTEKVLGTFQNPEDRLFKLRYAKYEWIRVTMENHRRNQWFNAGVLYWMLNDCWPAASGWASIDYYCIPTSGFYSFKRCAKPIVSSVWEENGKMFFAASNNGLNNRALKVCCRILHNDTEEKLLENKITVPGNDVYKEALELDLPQNGVLLCELWDGETMLDRSFYKCGSLRIVPCSGVQMEKLSDNALRLTATRYVHIAALSGDCVFEDNYFSMRKGEERVVSFRTEIPSEITLETYTLTECEA